MTIRAMNTFHQIDWLSRAEQVAPAIAANAAKHDNDDTFVAEAFALLKREGFFKAHIPVELGGYGASYSELCAVVRRIATACGSTALAFSMHCHLVAVAVWRWRNENAPTDGLLRRAAAEDLILVSSGGSDWLKSAGAAEKVDGGYRINARKIFSSGCPAGDLLVTSAVYDDPQNGATVLHFAVPFKAEGVSILDTWRVMGMRGTGSNDVVLHNVFVADAAISGKRPQGKWHPLFHTISLLAFPVIYSAYVGVAEGARDIALNFARRKSGDEATAQLAGELENALAAAQIAHDSMVALAETQKPGPHATSRAMICRTLIAQSAIKVVERALEVGGGVTFYRDAGLERAFRDVQAARFHPLQEKQQLRYTGRLALGLDIDG